MEDPVRLDRAPCAGARGCDDAPITSGSIAGAAPMAVSTSPSALRFDGSPRSERHRNEVGQVGKLPKDDSSRHDHATARRRPRNGVSSSQIEYLRSTGACSSSRSPLDHEFATDPCNVHNLLSPVMERIKLMDCAAFAASVRFHTRQRRVAPQS
jgi:hypothetical protein